MGGDGMNRRRLMLHKPTSDEEEWISGVPYDLSSYALFPNTYIDNNGNLVRYNGWSSTDFLPCHGVSKFVSTKNWRYCAMYDANKNYISGITINNGTTNNTHPEAYYIRFSASTPEFSSAVITPYS